MTQMSQVEKMQASNRTASSTEEVREEEMMHKIAKNHYK